MFEKEKDVFRKRSDLFKNEKLEDRIPNLVKIYLDGMPCNDLVKVIRAVSEYESNNFNYFNMCELCDLLGENITLSDAIENRLAKDFNLQDSVIYFNDISCRWESCSTEEMNQAAIDLIDDAIDPITDNWRRLNLDCDFEVFMETLEDYKEEVITDELIETILEAL